MAVSLSSNPPARDEPISFARVVDLLAPALGKEKSHELIESRAEFLGYMKDRLNVEQALQIIASLASEPGIVGVSARFAKTRLTTQEKARPMQAWLSAPPQAEPSAEPPPQPTISDATSTSITSKEIAVLLAASLGTEKSVEVVNATMARLSIAPGAIEMAQAQSILNLISKSPGIVGVAARFAKARLFLRPKSES
jgi:hypothetical protein